MHASAIGCSRIWADILDVTGRHWSGIIQVLAECGIPLGSEHYLDWRLLCEVLSGDVALLPAVRIALLASAIASACLDACRIPAARRS